MQAAGGGEWKGSATVIVSASCELRADVRGPSPPPASADPVRLDLRSPEGYVVQGHTLVFDLRVTNQGAVPLSGLLLHAHLPPGLEHFYGSDIELNLDPLGPGETRTEKLEAVADRAGRHVAEISVRAAGVAPAVARAAVTVRDDPVLGIRLLGPREAGAAPVVARATATVRDDPILGIRLVGPRETWTNREVEYRIEVTNHSPTVARDVLVLERLPPGVALVNVAAGGTYDVPSRTAHWRLGNLAPGQTRVLVVKLQARATGPALHDVAARTGQGHEARLQTVLKFWPQQSPADREH